MATIIAFSRGEVADVKGVPDGAGTDPVGGCWGVRGCVSLGGGRRRWLLGAPLIWSCCR